MQIHFNLYKIEFLLKNYNDISDLYPRQPQAVFFADLYLLQVVCI